MATFPIRGTRSAPGPVFLPRIADFGNIPPGKISTLYWTTFIVFIIIELLIKFSSGKNFLTGFLLNEAFFKLIIPILFLVFLYFALISYTTIPKNSYLQLFKRTFYLSIKKIHYFLPVFLLIAVKFFIIIKMLYLLFYLSTALSYIAGFVLSPGLFAWSRVLLIKMEEKVK